MSYGRMSIALACGDYDRTAALRDGSVRPEGVDLNYITLPVEETFHRMVKYAEFDAAELSLSTYVMTLSEDSRPFVALPVYPSRIFRHSGIYINTDSGISEPADLKGRVVGVPEYQVTAAVWIRGVLADFYGVPVDSVSYRTGGLHTPGRTEKFPITGECNAEIVPIGDTETLAEMLADGRIDALYTPRTPRTFATGHPKVRRLFEDSAAEERAYFAKTGIFPIMHVLVLRRDVYERNRWLAGSITKAFEQARLAAMTGIEETAALAYMLPWLHDEVARTREALGSDWWPYGIERNHTTLDSFLAYSYAQGLAARRWTVEDLFAPECLDTVIV